MKRAPDSKPTKVCVAGFGLRGSGYPNAWNTIRILRAQYDFEVIECGKWLPEEFRLWRFNKQPRLKAALQFAGLLAANALSVVQLLRLNRSRSITYVPYPSTFLLSLVSWVPARWRPLCACDAYVSIWDSFYQDRQMGTVPSLVTHIVLR